MNISIIGGDLRIARLAQLYAKEGKSVYTYGLEDFFASKDEKNNLYRTLQKDKETNIDISTQKNERVNLCKNLQEAIEKSNIIISGVPLSKDGINVNSPFAYNVITIEEVKNNIEEKGKTFIAGGIPKDFYNKNIDNIDLLENEKLTILNAIATVEGTIKIIIDEREETIFESNVLICGFGRIGKILCNRFKTLGAKVYCSARKEKDFTWIRESGCIPLKYDELYKYANKFDIIINTVPIMIIKEKEIDCMKKDVLIVDIASKPGGVDKEYAKNKEIKVIHALGIPGKELPTSAAKYIKEVVDSLIS